MISRCGTYASTLIQDSVRPVDVAAAAVLARSGARGARFGLRRGGSVGGHIVGLLMGAARPHRDLISCFFSSNIFREKLIKRRCAARGGHGGRGAPHHSTWRAMAADKRPYCFITVLLSPLDPSTSVTLQQRRHQRHGSRYSAPRCCCQLWNIIVPVHSDVHVTSSWRGCCPTSHVNIFTRYNMIVKPLHNWNYLTSTWLRHQSVVNLGLNLRRLHHQKWKNYSYSLSLLSGNVYINIIHKYLKQLLSYWTYENIY